MVFRKGLPIIKYERVIKLILVLLYKRGNFKMYFQLAWRNIWRNPRRTFVIISAVVIGVWSMVFLSAFSRGMLASMLDNGKSVLIGDIQIHNIKYRVDP